MTEHELWHNIKWQAKFARLECSVNSVDRVGKHWVLPGWTAKMDSLTLKLVGDARAVAGLKSVADCWGDEHVVKNYDGSRRQWPGMNYHFRTAGCCSALRSKGGKTVMCTNEAQTKEDSDDDAEDGAMVYAERCVTCSEQTESRCVISRAGVGFAAWFDGEGGNHEFGGDVKQRPPFEIFSWKVHSYLRNFDERHYSTNLCMDSLNYVITYWWNTGVLGGKFFWVADALALVYEEEPEHWANMSPDDKGDMQIVLDDEECSVPRHSTQPQSPEQQIVLLKQQELTKATRNSRAAASQRQLKSSESKLGGGYTGGGVLLGDGSKYSDGKGQTKQSQNSELQQANGALAMPGLSDDNGVADGLDFGGMSSVASSDTSSAQLHDAESVGQRLRDVAKAGNMQVAANQAAFRSAVAVAADTEGVDAQSKLMLLQQSKMMTALSDQTVGLHQVMRKEVDGRDCVLVDTVTQVAVQVDAIRSRVQQAETAAAHAQQTVVPAAPVQPQPTAAGAGEPAPRRTVSFLLGDDGVMPAMSIRMYEAAIGALHEQVDAASSLVESAMQISKANLAEFATLAAEVAEYLWVGSKHSAAGGAGLRESHARLTVLADTLRGLPSTTRNARAKTTPSEGKTVTPKRKGKQDATVMLVGRPGSSNRGRKKGSLVTKQRKAQDAADVKAHFAALDQSAIVTVTSKFWQQAVNDTAPYTPEMLREFNLPQLMVLYTTSHAQYGDAQTRTHAVTWGDRVKRVMGELLWRKEHRADSFTGTPLRLVFGIAMKYDQVSNHYEQALATRSNDEDAWCPTQLDLRRLEKARARVQDAALRAQKDCCRDCIIVSTLLARMTDIGSAIDVLHAAFTDIISTAGQAAEQVEEKEDEQDEVEQFEFTKVHKGRQHVFRLQADTDVAKLVRKYGRSHGLDQQTVTRITQELRNELAEALLIEDSSNDDNDGGHGDEIEVELTIEKTRYSIKIDPADDLRRIAHGICLAIQVADVQGSTAQVLADLKSARREQGQAGGDTGTQDGICTRWWCPGLGAWQNQGREELHDEDSSLEQTRYDKEHDEYLRYCRRTRSWKAVSSDDGDGDSDARRQRARATEAACTKEAQAALTKRQAKKARLQRDRLRQKEAREAKALHAAEIAIQAEATLASLEDGDSGDGGDSSGDSITRLARQAERDDDARDARERKVRLAREE